MTMPLIRESFRDMRPLGEVMHRRIMDLYRTYMLVGGMPKAVSNYIEKNSFAAAEDVKRSILQLYLNDAVKLDEESGSDKAASILKALPSNLSRHDKSFSPRLLKKDSRLRDYRRMISELGESMMVNLCYRSTEPAPDIESHSDHDDLKMYLCDTGLLFTLSFSTLRYDSDEVYRDVLSGDLSLNEGMYFENMVAQELTVSGHPLFFSKFMHRDSKKYQEVDFVIVRGRTPTAIEVKSGKRQRMHRSLDRYIDKFGDRIGMSYVVGTGDVDVQENITYLPVYMASLL